jgi:hypothetical protein
MVLNIRPFIFVLACCAALLFAGVSRSEESEYLLQANPWKLHQSVYEKAFQSEVADGLLIALDFRTIDPPPFDKWEIDERGLLAEKSKQGDTKYDNYIFLSHFVGVNLRITRFIVSFLKDNKDTQDAFRDELASTLYGYDPWRPCKKNIGTACARTAIATMFTYKNVVVQVEVIPRLSEDDPQFESRYVDDWSDEALVPKSPNGDTWDMVIAEWFLDILKSAPRLKELPEFPNPNNH